MKVYESEYEAARIALLKRWGRLGSVTPLRGRGSWVGLCTSVTAMRMTDAYGASSPAGVQVRLPLPCR